MFGVSRLWRYFFGWNNSFPSPEYAATLSTDAHRPGQGHDSIDFFWGYKEEGETIPEVVVPFGQPEPWYVEPSYLVEPIPDEYNTLKLDKEWKARCPIPPKSGLYTPRHLKDMEQQAIVMTELLDGVKLKPPLKAKYKDWKKGPRPFTTSPSKAKEGVK